MKNYLGDYTPPIANDPVILRLRFYLKMKDEDITKYLQSFSRDKLLCILQFLVLDTLNIRFWLEDYCKQVKNTSTGYYNTDQQTRIEQLKQLQSTNQILSFLTNMNPSNLITWAITCIDDAILFAVALEGEDCTVKQTKLPIRPFNSSGDIWDPDISCPGGIPISYTGSQDLFQLASSSNSLDQISSKEKMSTKKKVGITFGILGIVGLGAFLIYQGRKRR